MPEFDQRKQGKVRREGEYICQGKTGRGRQGFEINEADKEVIEVEGNAEALGYCS